MRPVCAVIGGLTLILAGCAALPPVPPAGSPEVSKAADIAECTSALLVAGIGGLTTLPAAALVTPACTRLAAEAIHDIITRVETKVRAVRAARGV